MSEGLGSGSVKDLLTEMRQDVIAKEAECHLHLQRAQRDSSSWKLLETLRSTLEALRHRLDDDLNQLP